MQEKDTRELIDRYLLGNINAEEEVRLSDLRKTNPEVELRVNLSVEAFRVLQYGRYQQIRQALKQIDALDANSPSRSRFRRWIIMSVVFVLSLLGLWLWFAIHYSPSSLASRCFQPVSVEFLLNHDMDHEEVATWKTAEESFVNRDYQSAILSFKSFKNSEDELIRAQAEWNILLARFAGEDPSSNWQSDMKEFESRAPENLKAQVSKLLRITESPFYRIVIFELPQQLSALKPQIM